MGEIRIENLSFGELMKGWIRNSMQGERERERNLLAERGVREWVLKGVF